MLYLHMSRVLNCDKPEEIVNGRDKKFGRTPLLEACLMNRKRIIHELVEMQAGMWLSFPMIFIADGLCLINRHNCHRLYREDCPPLCLHIYSRRS